MILTSIYSYFEYIYFFFLGTISTFSNVTAMHAQKIGRFTQVYQPRLYLWHLPQLNKKL